MVPPAWILWQQPVPLNLLSSNKSHSSQCAMCKLFFLVFFSLAIESPAEAAPAGRGPSPPQLSRFGASPRWVLRNTPLDQSGERAVKTHEPQTFFQFIKIEPGPPLELTNWSQKRRESLRGSRRWIWTVSAQRLNVWTSKRVREQTHKMGLFLWVTLDGRVGSLRL